MPGLTGPDTPFFHVEALLGRIDDCLPPSFTEPVRTVLVGGVAVHAHTAARVSRDLEAIHSRRLLLPPDLVVAYRDSDGRERLLCLDTNFASVIALLHPDALPGDPGPRTGRGLFAVRRLLHCLVDCHTHPGGWSGCCSDRAWLLVVADARRAPASPRDSATL